MATSSSPRTAAPEPTELFSTGAAIFKSLEELTTSEHLGWTTAQRHLVSESQRFSLWAHSLGLHRRGHASLDYRVRDALVVKLRLEDILSGLRDDLDGLLSIFGGERQPFDEDGNEDSESDSDTDTGPGDVDTRSRSSASSESFHEVDFRQQNITEAIDALYSLAAKIRNPRNRPERPTRELYKHIPAHLRDDYIREREDAEIRIVSYVQRQGLLESLKRGGGFELKPEEIEQYAPLSSFLVRRIGIANARRKQQFVYWKEHAARISQGDNSREPRESPRGKGPLLPQDEGNAASPLHLDLDKLNFTPSVPGKSLATSATRLDESFVIPGDLQSVISHQSRVSTILTPQGQKLHWPSPPEHLADPTAKFFICPYCHVMCPRGYLEKDAWRSHLVHDLKPYLCTYEICSDPNRLYGSHREWLDHENLHTRVWHCRIHEREFETQPEYTQHLRQDHPDATPEDFSSELIAASVGPSAEIHHRSCPLCSSGFTDVQDMQQHVKHHLERLALFSLPGVQQDGEGPEVSSDSRQVIQSGGAGGRLASVEEDFGSNDGLPYGEDSGDEGFAEQEDFGDDDDVLGKSSSDLKSAKSPELRGNILKTLPESPDLYALIKGWLTISRQHIDYVSAAAEAGLGKGKQPEKVGFQCPNCPRRFFGSQYLQKHIATHAHAPDNGDNPQVDVPASKTEGADPGTLSEKLSKVAEFGKKAFEKASESMNILRLANVDFFGDNAVPASTSQAGGKGGGEGEGEGESKGKAQKHPATFQCTLCPKRFTRAYNLRSHLRTHTDERPFVCRVCGKAFARQHDRQRHEDLHSGEKKFVCKGELKDGEKWGCGRRFARADALGRHFRSGAGRTCIKPLLDENVLERDDTTSAQVTGEFALPQALLAQYPALAQMSWSADGMGGGNTTRDDLSMRSGSDAGDDRGYISDPGSGVWPLIRTNTDFSDVVSICSELESPSPYEASEAGEGVNAPSGHDDETADRDPQLGRNPATPEGVS
ncbi:hypothetical protein B0H63DRAFT_464231 [Podospora didyma]|uniref:C2H2-type domain-containing protein n=1 Tax=Podospora didyma TaxID=330526 RepID=A0AAE0NXU8_9PEZI|nr:hypothetical protein B0H63DRAFT_464231 [Podospora didyma]